MANSSATASGSMIYDALNYLYQAGMEDRRQRGFKIIELDAGACSGDPRTVYYELDGKLETIHLPPSPISCHVSDDQSFVAAMLKLSLALENAAVFVGPQRIVGFLDYSDRLETVTLDLSFDTSHFVTVKLSEDPCLSQRELIRLLSNDLYYNGVEPLDLLPTVRKLRWSNATSGQSIVRHDGESLGNNIEMEVAGIEGGISPAMHYEGSVYQNFPTEDVTTHCTIEADAKSQQFYVRPILGTVEGQRRTAVNKIVDQLRAQLPGALVISGSPY